MTSRKQKTGNVIQNVPASALNKLLEEGINKEKLEEFRKRLLVNPLTISKMLQNAPEDAQIFTDLLKDWDPHVRTMAAGILGSVAANKLNIGVAIPALVKALRDENEEVRRSAAFTLRNAAENGTVITYAIPMLVEALEDEYWIVQSIAANTLWGVAKKEKCNEKIRETIIARIVKVVHSDRFMVEAEKNSDYFIHLIVSLDLIFSKIRESESNPQEARP